MTADRTRPIDDDRKDLITGSAAENGVPTRRDGQWQPGARGSGAQPPWGPTASVTLPGGRRIARVVGEAADLIQLGMAEADICHQASCYIGGQSSQYRYTVIENAVRPTFTPGRALNLEEAINRTGDHVGVEIVALINGKSMGVVSSGNAL